MRQLHGVLWTKGTLLTPQHLQVQDRYLQDLMQFKLLALAYRPWGFRELELDREALGAGTFSISRASGVLPDGSGFSIPEADPGPSPFPLDQAWDDPDRDAMVVHLSLPEHRPGSQNVAADRNERDARYVTEVILRRDENTGRSEKPIQVARKNFRLREGRSEGVSGSALPVARITRSDAGEFQVDSGFVPPLIDFTASDQLHSMARRLLEVLTARSGDLAGSRRQRGKGLADFGVADVASFWLLYTLNSHLPRFRHLLESRRGHPAHLFEAMLGLAGSLTTFSDQVAPGDLPAYDHSDLGACFRALDEQIHLLLATVIPQRHASLPMREVRSSVHAVALDDDRYLRATGVFLAVRSEASKADLIQKLPQLAKVSSGDRVERLIKHALPGVGIRHVADPPRALPVKLDLTYFQLEQAGEDWEAIRRARNLAAYVPSDFPATELELVLVLPGDADD